MRYDVEIDHQTWAFIRETERFYPSDYETLSIEKQRNVYNKMAQGFLGDRPVGLRIEDEKWDGIPVRIYTPQTATCTLVYYHGGGYCLGNLDSHDDVCAEFASGAELRVVSVDYRLAPEFKHPSQFNDAYGALKFASNTYSGRLIVAGDSAGANLVAACCHAARNADLDLAGQVLIYPTLGTKMDIGSFIEHANAPMLTTQDMQFYNQVRCVGPMPEHDPTFAPLNDTRFNDLPPTIIFTAACDPLADDGQHYCAKIVRAGGKAHWINEAGLVHGYLRARKTVNRAKDSFERMVETLIALKNEQWPY